MTSRLRIAPLPMLVCGALLGVYAPAASACPYDPPRGDTPQDARTNVCGAWDAAVARGFNPGTPLNETHPWAEGYTRDFSGGYYERGGIMERHGEGWASIVGGSYWDALIRAGGAPKIGYPDGPHVFGGHINEGPRGNTYMTFTKGVINKSSFGTFASYGAILAHWDALGGVSGPVGLPTSDEADTARVPGRYQTFEGGNLIWDRATGKTWHVYGGILNKYAQLGYSNHPLGLPASDRKPGTRGGDHVYQVFQGGVINQYGGNAYETHGVILERWNELGGPTGRVGLPTSDEQQTARLPGRYSTFEGGNLIFNPRINRVQHVYGGILNKYAQLGYSNHPLGLPTSDRKPGSRGGDHVYQTFDGGVINQYGGNAYETHGTILERWNRAGGPTGALGLPTSDEQDTARSPQGTIGRFSRFEHGVINFNPTLGKAFVLFGAIGAKYAKLGYASSYLGLPVGEEFDVAGGKQQNFEGGYILYKPGVGARTDRELSEGQVIALGDSFSSGEGNPPFYGGDCHRSSQAWPKLLSQSPTLELYKQLACSGATTRALTESFKGQPPQLNEAASVAREARYVTITIGGNDVDFAGVLMKCFFATPCTKDGRLDTARHNIARLGDRMDEVYRSISDRVGRTKVVVVGYPRLFPVGDEDCLWLQNVEKEELGVLSELLNKELRDAAQRANVRYVETMNVLSGHELCTPDPWVNRLGAEGGETSNKGHPNVMGQNAMARVVRAALE